MPILGTYQLIQEMHLLYKTNAVATGVNPPANAEKVETIIRALLYGLVVFAPLAIYPTVLNQALSLKYLLFKEISVVVIFLYLAKGLIYGTKIRISGLELSLAIFLFLLVISTALSLNLHMSIEGNYLRYDGLISFLSCIALFFVAVQSFKNKATVETVVRFGVVSAVLVSTYGIAQSQGLDPFPWAYRMFEGTRSSSTFGNPIILGGYLSLMLPLAVTLALQSKTSFQRTLNILATVLIAVCLITTMSRAAWVAGLFGLAILGVGYAQKKGFTARIVAIPAAIAAMVVFLASLAVGLPMMAGKISSAFGFNGSIDSRFLMWESAFKMVPERPLFGFGPDTLGLIFSRYEVPGLIKYDPSGTFDNVHNAFLQLAVTTGIPAMATFVFILAFVCFKTYKNIRENRDTSLVTVGLLSGIVAFTIQSLTGVTGIVTSGFMWLYMGVLASSWSQPGIEIKPVRSANRYIIIATATIVCLFASIFVTKPFISESALAQARLATQEGDVILAEANYKTAISYDPNDDKAYSELGIMLVDSGQSSHNISQWSRGVKLLGESVRLSPYNRENNILLGLGYLYGGRAFNGKYFNAAVKPLAEAVRLDPRNYRAVDFLGMAYLETGRMEKAYANIAKALNINSNDAQTHYHMGRYYEKAKRQEKALNEYATALKLDPNYKNAKTAYERLVKHGYGDFLKHRN